MAIPETISVGLADRLMAGVVAQAVATALRALDVQVIDWTVGLGGEVRMSVRLGGEAVRVFEFSGAPPGQAGVLAAIPLRVAGLEGHV